MKKILKVLLVITSILMLFLLYVQFTYKQKFDAPVTGIRASQDSAIIARGKYLVLGPSHCFDCHASDSTQKSRFNKPLSGGRVFETPFADFYVPNITSDKETGIGSLTDEQIARAIRYNITHNNEALAPFMTYNNFSDEDLTAIVSYLKSTAPIKHEVPKHNYNMLGKIIMRFMLKPNYDAKPEVVKADTTALYGKYLAYTVALCNGCHTNRDKLGKFVGAPFAGGYVIDEKTEIFITPNLTPDDSTGRISHWSEDVFIQRFRAGRAFEKSPMPWEAYQTMTDQDLKALYNFFKSLPPVKNDVGQTYRKKSPTDA